MLARVLEVLPSALPPLPKAAPKHRARDAVDLRDPLYHAMMRAHHGLGKSLATPEQTLAELVLKMRLVDAARR